MAYIVCDAIGIDSGDYSFAYVARWSEGFTELVKDTAERVVTCAKKILDGFRGRRDDGRVVALREYLVMLIRVYGLFWKLFF